MFLLDKVTKNVIAIGSTICGTSFGFSAFKSISTVSKIQNLGYRKFEEPKEINDIGDIEMLQHVKGCKFLFYKESESDTFEKGNFKEARQFEEENKGTVVNLVKQKKHKEKCEKGSYVYLSTTVASTSSTTTSSATTSASNTSQTVTAR